MKLNHFPVLFLMAVCFVSFSACGKKGPPVYVVPTLEMQVKQLSATLDGGRIHLQGTVTNIGSLSEKGFANIGCKVFLAVYPLNSPPCEGCPLKYKLYGEIKGPVISKNNFSCALPLEKKTGIYYFRVALSGPEGETGPFSEPKKLNIEE